MTCTSIQAHKDAYEQLRTLRFTPTERNDHVYSMKFKVNDVEQTYSLKFKNQELYSVSSAKRNDFSSSVVSAFVYAFFADYYSQF